MAQKLDLWEKSLENTMINLLKGLEQNVGNMHEQIGNFSIEVETFFFFFLRNKIDLPGMKNMLSWMKKSFK